MSNFIVESNRDQILRYLWRGHHKQCAWSENETGRFDWDTMGQDAEESALIVLHLEKDRQRGKI
jgi:hypothetical protein